MIFKKTPEEIKKEEQKFEEEYKLSKAYSKELKCLPDPKKEVCEYYVVSKTKGKIDIWDLSTLDIVGYILNHYKEDSLKIFEYCKPEQIVIKDWDTLRAIMDCEAKHGHIVRDILGSMDKNHMLDTAQSIAFYKKEIDGEKISSAKVVEQLAKNELLKQQQQENKV